MMKKLNSRFLTINMIIMCCVLSILTADFLLDYDCNGLPQRHTSVFINCVVHRQNVCLLLVLLIFFIIMGEYVPYNNTLITVS